MTRYSDGKNNTYLIDTTSPIASGGEGDICSIQGVNGKVAKIFHAKSLANNSMLKNKISYMVDIFQQLDDTTQKRISSQITWPEKYLCDNEGNLCGYIMQKVTGHETLDCAFYQSHQFASNFDQAQKITIAKNLCIAVNTMHRMGFVVGDFNAKNIMVDVKKGTVYLVDSDSFHLREERAVRGRKHFSYYPSRVGRPEYLPYELHKYVKDQNAQLDNITQPSFNRESDLFALAIHIFQLLMNGYHPYGLKVNPAVRVESVSKVDVNWVTNIKEKKYVYSNSPEMKKRVGNYVPPTGAPPISLIPMDLRNLFEQAFNVSPDNEKLLERKYGDHLYLTVKSVRPSAAEWYAALDKYSSNLIKCAYDSSHYYSSSLRSCPWCGINK